MLNNNKKKSNKTLNIFFLNRKMNRFIVVLVIASVALTSEFSFKILVFVNFLSIVFYDFGIISLLILNTFFLKKKKYKIDTSLPNKIRLNLLKIKFVQNPLRNLLKLLNRFFIVRCAHFRNHFLKIKMYQ